MFKRSVIDILTEERKWNHIKSKKAEREEIYTYVEQMQ